MYYILKERRIIKHFAVIAEEVLREWDQVRAKKQSFKKKNSLFKKSYRSFFVTCKISEQHHHHLHAPYLSHIANTRVKRQKKFDYESSHV
jgi:hypothetical protein